MAQRISNRLVMVSIGLTLFAMGRSAWAEEQTLQGEVVDPASYIKEGHHGAEMVNQTYEALDGGQTLALLEDGTQTLYLLLAENPGEDPNELVYDYVNQRLTVKGTVYERSGVKGIVIASVQAQGQTDNTAPAPPAESAAPAPATP